MAIFILPATRPHNAWLAFKALPPDTLLTSGWLQSEDLHFSTETQTQGMTAARQRTC